jgi:hypothetical protein
MMISLYILEGIIEKVFATVDLNDSYLYTLAFIKGRIAESPSCEID